jgi:hypothetical protein
MTTGEEHPRSILGSDSVGDHRAGDAAGTFSRPVVRLDPAEEPARAQHQVGLFDAPPSAFGGRPQHRPRSPFLATTDQLPVISPRSRWERTLNGAYRLRSVLALTRAAAMTIAIVSVFRSSAGGGDLTSVAGPTTTQVRSAIEAVTDFDSDAAVSSGPTTTVTGETQVGSEVDSSSSTAQTTSPAATRPPAPESSDDETSTSQTSTTVPQATTTVLDGSPSSDTGAGNSTETSVDPTSSSTTAEPQPTKRLFEAEDGLALGTALPKTDHAGYTGSGYIGQIFLEGAGVTFTVEQQAAGPTPLTIRYAAGDNIPLQGPRTLSIMVNGATVRQLSMEQVGAWTDWWDLEAGTIDLVAGANEISLVWIGIDTGWVNIDSITLG